MGWGHKAIEIRSVDTGELDGVFMHKKPQKLKFLCERNDKVRVLPTTMVKVKQIIYIAVLCNPKITTEPPCSLYPMPLPAIWRF